MIEITERIALALNTAVKVLEADDYREPLRFLAKIDGPIGDESVCEIGIAFWIHRDPETKRNVRVLIRRKGELLLAENAILSRPGAGIQSRWDIDELGNLKRY
jgi:hypothetical protein